MGRTAFSQACKVGQAEADDRAERSYYERVVGYTYDSEKVFQYQGKIICISAPLCGFL